MRSNSVHLELNTTTTTTTSSSSLRWLAQRTSGHLHNEWLRSCPHLLLGRNDVATVKLVVATLQKVEFLNQMHL